jgi:glycosyltransferase involved in cell wall biosynthesis
MTSAPLLSYIVLSYNYEKYIGTTIRSILDQTMQDFEIVVVDDASSDGSLDVIKGFDDQRIRLLVNENNRGAALSYNRALDAVRGEWLVNLDADDWIAPQKAEVQLAAVAANPHLDIIGTYVNFVDSAGAPHPRAPEFEAYSNVPREFGLVDNWIAANYLCRSSTMVRRSTHIRLGYVEPSMISAPDYEFWTRALREDCCFLVVPQPLTFSRVHSKGVTHADPVGKLLELTYAMLRNLVPLAEARALNPSLERIIAWAARHPQLSDLRPIEAYRLLGMLMTSPPLDDFASFRAALSAPEGDQALINAGRRCLILHGEGSSLSLYARKLERDIEAYIEAREYWRQRSETRKRASLWSLIKG